jgi:hypothetical protein
MRLCTALATAGKVLQTAAGRAAPVKILSQPPANR